jgi:hypothetical protein
VGIGTLCELRPVSELQINTKKANEDEAEEPKTNNPTHRPNQSNKAPAAAASNINR